MLEAAVGKARAKKDEGGAWKTYVGSKRETDEAERGSVIGQDRKTRGKREEEGEWEGRSGVMKSTEEVSTADKKSESVSGKIMLDLKKKEWRRAKGRGLRPPRHSLQQCSPDSSCLTKKKKAWERGKGNKQKEQIEKVT